MSKNDNKEVMKEAQEVLEKGYSDAEDMISNVDKTEEFLNSLEEKINMIPKVGKKLSVIPVMIQMVRDYIHKKYTRVPAGTIVAIVSALIYVFNPFDVIPDTVPAIGFFDDAAVIAVCLKLVSSDVDDYKEWKKSLK